MLPCAMIRDAAQGERWGTPGSREVWLSHSAWQDIQGPHGILGEPLPVLLETYATPPSDQSPGD